MKNITPPATIPEGSRRELHEKLQQVRHELNEKLDAIKSLQQFRAEMMKGLDERLDAVQWSSSTPDEIARINRTFFRLRAECSKAKSLETKLLKKWRMRDGYLRLAEGMLNSQSIGYRQAREISKLLKRGMDG